jgi:Uma2 family endonuclease
MSTTAEPLTVDEFLALPSDGLDRELIQGDLRIRGDASEMMTVRNRGHAQVTSTITFELESWNRRTDPPLGRVFSGEVGCILRQNPATVVGVDVAYFTRDLLEKQTGNSTRFEGAPRLAVEVLSPSDKQSDIAEKVEEYLATGAALVWIVDPRFETVTVHRPDAKPELFNADQEVTGEPHLPGLQIAVERLFR